MKNFNLRRKKAIAWLIVGVFIIANTILEAIAPQLIKAEPIYQEPVNLTLATIQENALLATVGPAQSFPGSRKLDMVITAYSSTVGQTDNDPFITASGKMVRDGIAANNLLPFGTKIKIPEIYGDKIFVIEDRMNARKSDYHLDIWFPEYGQALRFGAQKTHIEVLED